KHVVNSHKIKMIYADAGQETRFSSLMQKVPACRVKFVISESFQIETNMVFDTGFNKKFSLATNLDLDSVLNLTGKSYSVVQNKKLSLGKQKNSLFSLAVDSVLIENRNMGNELILKEAHPMQLSVYGETNWTSLCGMEFLQNF